MKIIKTHETFLSLFAFYTFTILASLDFPAYYFSLLSYAFASLCLLPVNFAFFLVYFGFFNIFILLLLLCRFGLLFAFRFILIFVFQFSFYSLHTFYFFFSFPAHNFLSFLIFKSIIHNLTKN